METSTNRRCVRLGRGDAAVPARVAGALVCACVAFVACSEPGGRQAEVAARGAEVMPFDLDATTHRFTKTASGGVQTVTADDPSDEMQVQLIREHLRVERDDFSRGDFDDPARIHGTDMPGVAELSAGFDRIEVGYAEVAGGAQLTYTSEERELVDAVHAWFDRQVMDHGDHAEAG